MSATLNAYGLRPVYHPSGIIRQVELLSGIASGYATNLFTGTPVKYETAGGTLVAVTTGADVCIGVFQGCEFASAGRYFVSPYWPASQTYDSTGPMRVYYTQDKEIVYEAQANGPVAMSANWESINLANTSQGSTLTGLSSQALTSTTTGATAGTFQVIGLALYDDNSWGDAFTQVRVKISSYQGVIA